MGLLSGSGAVGSSVASIINRHRSRGGNDFDCYFSDDDSVRSDREGSEIYESFSDFGTDLSDESN